MSATRASETESIDAARRARLRRLAALTPSERVERLHSLNQQLARLREDARRTSRS